MQKTKAVLKFPTLKSIKDVYQDLQKIIKLTAVKKADGYTIRNNLLYRDNVDKLLLVVPKTLQTSIIRNAHEQGHFGVNKTEALI